MWIFFHILFYLGTFKGLLIPSLLQSPLGGISVPSYTKKDLVKKRGTEFKKIFHNLACWTYARSPYSPKIMKANIDDWEAFTLIWYV